MKAIESFPGGIPLILGRKDKKSDYTTLRPLLHERVKRVYTIGAAAEKIEAHIAGAVEVVHAETLPAALAKAHDAAVAGGGRFLGPARPPPLPLGDHPTRRPRLHATLGAMKAARRKQKRR